MMSAFKLFEQSYLPSQLTPIGLKELTFLKISPCDVWVFENGEFSVELKAKEDITKNTLRSLVARQIFLVFVANENLTLFQEQQQRNLRIVTRGLSIGDSLQNAKKQMSLLSVNMGYLYKDPVNDQALDLQFQSAKNLAHFCMDNHRALPQLFAAFANQRYHYTLAQPLLSSFLLAAFLKFSKHFSTKEIETLFLASYFKDIGMSLLPNETYDKTELSAKETRLVKNHTQHSIDLLQGRVPLNPNYLHIIGNHHTHSLIKSVEEDRHDMVEGIETLLVVMMDMLAAMISPRPYREGMSVYAALEKLKVLYATTHPKEFKYLIYFIQKFFGQF